MTVTTTADWRDVPKDFYAVPVTDIVRDANAQLTRLTAIPAEDKRIAP